MGVLRAKLALDEGSWGDLHPSLLGRATNVRTIHVSVGIMVPKRSLVDTRVILRRIHLPLIVIHTGGMGNGRRFSSGAAAL